MDNERKQYTEEDHGRDRKIKSEFFFLHPDIAGQPSDPVHLVVKEIDQQSHHNNDHSKTNDIFSCILIHFCNLQTVDGRRID
jgi:hypothetical protein